MSLYLNILFQYCSRVLLLICCFGFINLSIYAQRDVSTIYGDEGGYFTSSSTSKTDSKDSNHLIGFRVGDSTYSTGVNDAILTAHGVSFLAREFQAFTVPGDIIYNSSELLGVAANWGGVAQNYTASDYIYSFNPIIPSYFMRDGTNGLELGTNFFNIKAQEIVYENILVNALAGIGDGVPDIIATQTGAPSSSYDIFKFVDSVGVKVGESVSVVFNKVAIVGGTKWSIYSVNTNTGAVNGKFAINSRRDLRLLTFDLEDFGIDDSNLSEVATFVHYTSGSTDIAFTAFNKASIRFIPVDLMLTSELNSPTDLCSSNSVEFKTTIYNTASSNSSGFEVNMPIQSGLNYVSSNAVFSGGAGSASYNSGTNLWVVTALEDGESVELTVNVSVSSLVLPLTYTNTISHMAEVDYDLSNNSVTISVDDADCDGIYDSEDSDDDNDGILDVIEGEDDTDGDGVINRLDLDSDNDGIYDFVEAGGDPSLNVDGRIDDVASHDANDNGVYDLYDTEYGGTAIGDDTDSDGVLDTYEWDSDGDGCADVIEGGMSDGDDDHYLAESPLTVDEDGCVMTSNGYALVVGSTSYTTPNDYNNNGVYDFKEIGIPVFLAAQPMSMTISNGDNVSFTIEASTATIIKWQVNDGYGWDDVVDGGVYSGSSTTELMLTSPSKMVYDNYLYRVFLSSPSYACTNDTLSAVCLLNIDNASGRDISGLVFSEQNINDNIVNGDSISSLDGNQLSVVLYDLATNAMVDIAPVVNGSYIFYNMSTSLDYELVLDTGLYNDTYVSIGHELPKDWYFSGEKQNNASNSLTGNDGDYNGRFSVLNGSGDEGYINFGLFYASTDSNTIICFNDSTLVGWNPSLPPENPINYTTALPWQYASSGSDYPGGTSVVGSVATQMVKYWVEWSLPTISATFRDSCNQFFIYKFDLESPIAACQDLTIYLDSIGSCSLSASEVDNGSYDNIGIETTSLDAYSFDCEDLGDSSVMLIVTDSAGLSDSCTANITVLDTISPWITMSPSDTTIFTSEYNPKDPIFADNCTIETMTWEMTGATMASSLSTGINCLDSTTFNEGVTTITYTATDASGNADSLSFDVFYRIGCLEYLSDQGVYLVQNAADLICLSNSSIYWDKDIRQVVDIDFDVNDDGDFSDELWGATNAGKLILGGDWDISGVVDGDDEEGFSRIGNSSLYFTGTYQGASWDETTLTLNVDHSIKNLFINRDDSWGDGLFAFANKAYIKNVHLIDVDISSRGQAGALIGYATTDTVEDCSSSGCLFAGSYGREVGGLIGFGSVIIRRSSSSCTVISTATNQENIGGLVGKLNYSGKIINCSASGDVYAQYVDNVGGLVGFAIRATVEESYATGFVHGEQRVGGLIGNSEKSTVSNSYSAGAIMADSVAGSFIGSADKSNGTSSLVSCYATGNVALSGAITSLGAFVGFNSGTTYNNCYYDEETTGAADSSLNDISTGSDDNIMAYTTSDFSALVFSSGVWSYDNNTYGRPYLAWQNDGTSDYNVSNPVPSLIDGGFSQEATYLGSGVLLQGLRYAKIRPLAYDDFSNNAYGWDDGSSASTWPAGDSYSGFALQSVTEMKYTHPSGISVLGGDDYLAATGTGGSDQSKFVFRELKGLDETFYVSFLARFSSTVSNSWSFIALGKKDSIDDSGVALGTIGSGSKLGAAFANNGNLISRIGTAAPIGGQTYFVVGKWTCDASGNITRIDTWINPTSPDSEEAEYSDYIDGISDQMSAIDIQSYYSGSSNIDEIRVGRTWSSVVPSLSADLNWIDVSPATSTSGNTFTIEQPNLDNGSYYVQPYIIKADGFREYGDMSCVEVGLTPPTINISTDSVTKITENTAKLYGNLSEALNITEYGFYYSTSKVTANLVNGSTTATEVKVYSGVAADYNKVNVSASISGLTNRKGYYFRLYVKGSSGNYYYGNVIRFLSEKRDFSLALDGDGDFLLIDSTTTHDVINDWGASENTFSVDFWMRNASSDTTKMVIISDTCTDYSTTPSTSLGYMIAYRKGMIYFENRGYLNRTDSVVFDQEWHHIACTYKDRENCIYVDGRLITSKHPVFWFTRPNVNLSCKIGCTKRPNDPTKFYYFNGNIDAMRFWNVALTADQISELCYDNVQSNPSSNTITCIASGRAIPGLTAGNLTASLGFNVMSTQESVGTVPVDIYYPSQEALHYLPFFHADTRLPSDSTSFNIVAVGDAHPSPYLPRVHWRYNPTDSVWMNSSNWGGFAYPGQGIDSSAYPDVFPTLRSVNDSASCLYTIVDSSAIRPVVTGTPPVVQILVDKEGRIGTYRVDESDSKLRIIKGFYPRMFDAADIDSKDGAIDIEEGSLEVFQ